MPKQICRAVILAAGRGTRMGSITEETPKPMLSVGGKPLIEQVLQRLASAGFGKFLLVVGFEGKQIEKHFKPLKYDVEFVRQDPVDGTASAALLARSFAAEDSFLLSYGDILCDPSEYTRLLAVGENKPAAAAVIAVKEVDDPWQGAAVYEIGGRVTKIIEKPSQGTSITRWNSAGFYLFKPGVFSYLERVQPSARGEYELTSALSAMLSDRLELHISPVAGTWRDVGRPEDLAAVEGMFPAEK